MAVTTKSNGIVVINRGGAIMPGPEAGNSIAGPRKTVMGDLAGHPPLEHPR